MIPLCSCMTLTDCSDSFVFYIINWIILASTSCRRIDFPISFNISIVLYELNLLASSIWINSMFSP
jgi:hypothetical protein